MGLQSVRIIKSQDKKYVIEEGYYKTEQEAVDRKDLFIKKGIELFVEKRRVNELPKGKVISQSKSITLMDGVIMLKKTLLYLLGALMFILWAGQPGQCQSPPEIPMKKRTCGDLWPVVKDKKCGYIDKTGRLIIPFKFDGADNFSEGLAAVRIKEKTGYIDATGKFVISPPSLSGFPFSDGMALVVIREFEKDHLHMHKLGYINRSGKLVIQRKEAWDSKSLHIFYKELFFSEGLVSVEQNGKVGFIDKAGRQVIPPRYENAEPFSEGLAAVMIKGQYGYIDRSGKMVIPPQFEDAGPFSEGLAIISFNGDQWSYIDKSGKLVINGEEFVVARAFSEGLAAVMGKNEKYGFIDKTGKFVIQPQFHRVGDFSEGLAAVRPVDATGPATWHISIKRVEIVIKSMSTLRDSPMKAEFDLHYYRFCGGVARVSLGNEEDSDLEGYINKEGKFIWSEVTRSKEELR